MNTSEFIIGDTMGIIEMPDWIRRNRNGKAKPYEEAERFQKSLERGVYKMPEDMMRQLDEALLEERRGAPLGTPAPRPRTAATIAAELDHLREELNNARELVKVGEAKEALLVTERDKAIDDEIAAKKVTHETELAELEALRQSTGEPS